MARTMELFMMAPVALAVVMASAADCSTSFENPTGCVASTIDAGSANDVTCNLGWACNSNSEHYQIICTTTSTPGNVACTCTSDQNNLSSQIIINDDFICNGTGALPVVDKCGNWDLVLQM
jgi:hypothetical protein